MDNDTMQFTNMLIADASKTNLINTQDGDLFNKLDENTRNAVIEHGVFQSREELERFLYQRNEISGFMK